jgi:hypothetical protein
MSDTMIASGPEIWFRAIGTTPPGLSVAFAGYMLAYGGGKVRVNGIDHLAIFAQPRGPATAGATVIARSPESKQFDASEARLTVAAPGRSPRPRNSFHRLCVILPPALCQYSSLDRPAIGFNQIRPWMVTATRS